MSARTGGGHRRGEMGGGGVEGGAGASWAICVAMVFACVLQDNIDVFFSCFFLLFFFLFWDKVNHSPAAIWSHDTAWADGNIVFCKALDNKNNAF